MCWVGFVLAGGCGGGCICLLVNYLVLLLIVEFDCLWVICGLWFGIALRLGFGDLVTDFADSLLSRFRLRLILVAVGLLRFVGLR